MKASSVIRAAWLAALAVLPVGLLQIVHHLDQPDESLEPYRVNSMRIVESHAETPPIDAEWQTIDGSTRLHSPIRRDRFVSGWIAIDPPPDAAGNTLALYMPDPQANVAVYLDTAYVGDSGDMVRPLPFYTRPLYYRLPLSTPEAAQTIYVRIAREGGWYSPNAVYIGPDDLLEEKFRQQKLYTFWLPAVVAILMLGLSMALAALYWMSGRKFVYYGIYALIVLLWALHTTHELVDDIPIEHWTWFTIIYVLLWWVILAPSFASRFFDLRMRALEWTILVSGVVLSLPIIVLLAAFRIEALFTYFALVWVPFVLICSLTALVLYGVACWRNWSFESVGMYALGAVGFVFNVRDHLYDFWNWVPGTTYYTKYVAVAQIAFISLLLARRYTASARELETLNRELEERVQNKARELEAGYEERRILERERTLSQERERLMRDMHDGLGGQLIQAIAMSENNDATKELRNSLENALIDLRLIVDSIAPEQNDLVSLLASFRHRTKKIWEKSGVRLIWDMADIPKTALGPERSLNVLRIVQEATTNALQHAHPKTVRITARSDPDKVCVEIGDDGVGFDVRSAKEGFGLANMRRRAEEAGLVLIINSDHNGTRIQICIPNRGDSGAGDAPHTGDLHKTTE